ncbi:MAG: hypothetical protein ACHQDB_07990 [Steroidobacterales bacterium]
MRPRVYALIVGSASLGLLRCVCAADAPVDDDLLEFLGSVDSEDKAWQEYLAGTDIDQVARRAGNVQPSKPATPPPPNRAQGPGRGGGG